MTNALKEEISQNLLKNKTKIRNLLMYRGYKAAFDKPIDEAKIAALESLYLNCEKYINKNDLILGSFNALFSDRPQNQAELKLADEVCRFYGFNSFITNYDHFTPDYEKLLKIGIDGLLDEVEVSLKNHSSNPKKVEFLMQLKQMLFVMSAFIKGYGEAALAASQEQGYNKKELTIAASDLMHISKKAPASFRQALQLLWITHLMLTMEGRYAMALGRVDMYLYPFYKNDISSKKITREEALQLIENALIKIDEHRLLGSSDVVNICIGGYAVDGSVNVNELSYLFLEAVKNCNVAGPNLSARLTKDTPDEFLDECLKVIGTGIGYPALMNDEINIPALLSAGYDKDDVINYTFVGCIENFITGKQPPWSDGRFDVPNYIENVLNGGRQLQSGLMNTPAKEITDITSMDIFVEEYKKQLKEASRLYYARFMCVNSNHNPHNFKQPLLSLLCDNCIQNALDINLGGAKYPSVHGVACMGIGTAADSLAAIEKVVFIDKKCTLESLKQALADNFIGHEQLREELLAAPKYGNNNDFADKYAVWYIDTMAELFSDYRTRDGGLFYIAAAANTSNIYAGEKIGAMPDGRLKGEPLSDAASPTYGKDKRGATSTFNSVTKPDYQKVLCGSVINQKFSPIMFTDDEKRAKLLELVKAYFKKGGQELQINATSKETLLDAMKNPSKYTNLIVRVSGFSAYFITLEDSVKKDILMRTQQR